MAVIYKNQTFDYEGLNQTVVTLKDFERFENLKIEVEAEASYCEMLKGYLRLEVIDEEGNVLLAEDRNADTLRVKDPDEGYTGSLLYAHRLYRYSKTLSTSTVVIGVCISCILCIIGSVIFVYWVYITYVYRPPPEQKKPHPYMII